MAQAGILYAMWHTVKQQILKGQLSRCNVSMSCRYNHLISFKVRGVVDDKVLVNRLAGQEEVPGLGHQGGQVGGHQLAEELHKGLHQLQSLQLQTPACCILLAAIAKSWENGKLIL